MPDKVYFDTCCLNRPLDSKGNPRVAVEAEAMLVLLQMCESGSLQLVSSEVLLLEAGRNPYPERKAFVESALEKLAVTVVPMNVDVLSQAVELEKRGFRGYDATHFASANMAGVKYLCTCDDRFQRRSQSETNLKMTVLSPIELVKQVSK